MVSNYVTYCITFKKSNKQFVILKYNTFKIYNTF